MNNMIEKYSQLKPKDLSSIRTTIDPKAYTRSISIVLFWCIFDFIFYLSSIFFVFTVNASIAKLFFGLIAGIAISSMFVLAHDAAHGSLIKNKWLAETVGTVFMLPSLNIYRLWCYGHNRIHHGFTSFSPVDWIWRPLSIEEYLNLNKFKKFLYKMERSLYGCAIHYIIKVWWAKMLFFIPSGLPRQKITAINLGKLVVLIFAILFGTFCYLNGGWIIVIAGLVVPFIVFNYMISLIVYLHHTHPDIPFFDQKTQWNQSIGMIYCTTVIYTNWLISNITHYILIHTPHHIDIRIPFYRLKTAFNSLKTNHSEYLHEYTLKWSTLQWIFKTCKLYDYNLHKWYTFASAKKLLLSKE
jgi:acyl-lipid omega-6 desaturase (Delta-12 desaturase)